MTLLKLKNVMLHAARIEYDTVGIGLRDISVTDSKSWTKWEKDF